jgi:hypothetical protein
MVEWGARKLFDAISQVKSALSHDQLEKAKKLFESVISTARRWQDTGESRRRKEEYLRQHGEVSTELTFGGDSSP